MKTYQKFLFIFIFFLSAISTAEPAVSLVDWQSSEGLKRLSQSEHKMDFPSLANQFQNQFDKLSCGPTTGAIVLNALRLNKKISLPKMSFPKKYKRHLPKILDPRVARYSPESFMNPNNKLKNIKTSKQLYGQPINKKKDLGLQLRQLHEIFLSHGIDSKLRVANKNLSNEVIKQELINNLKTKEDYVVINYKRTELRQKGGGHISPLGAYDEKTDSFLIMDVNSTRYNWVWVKTKDLILSMRSFDTKENRGYLLLKESKPI